MADQKLTALSEVSVPALEDLLYTVDDPAGTPVSNKLTAARNFGQLGVIPGGRLTLTTGVPITTTDVTGAGTLYYTPYLHDKIRVWDGTRWVYKTFAESSLALTVTSGKNYDVFLDDDAATLSLSSAWTNDTTRADALGTQNGIVVLDSDHTKLWLGTIRASGTNTCEDSAGGTTTQVGGKRFLCNAYNDVPRPLRVIDTTDDQSYSTATIRVAFGATAPLNCVEFVQAWGNRMASAQAYWAAFVASTGGNGLVGGLGLDSTTAFSGIHQTAYETGGGSTISFGGAFDGFSGAGYHYFSWLQKGTTSTSALWIGDGGGVLQTGLIGWVMG